MSTSRFTTFAALAGTACALTAYAIAVHPRATSTHTRGPVAALATASAPSTADVPRAAGEAVETAVASAVPTGMAAGQPPVISVRDSGTHHPEPITQNVSAVPALASEASTPASAAPARLSGAPGGAPAGIPLWFEPAGDDSARFVARRSGFEMLVDGTGARLHFAPRPTEATEGSGLGAGGWGPERAAFAELNQPRDGTESVAPSGPVGRGLQAAPAGATVAGIGVTTSRTHNPQPTTQNGSEVTAPVSEASTPASEASAPASKSLAVHFLGARDVTPVAERRLPGVTHYYIGNDPAAWRTNVPQFGAVRLPEVYPGIDVVFYGNPAALEYDIVVAPGANPTVPRLQLDGAQSVTVAVDGGLVANVDGRQIVQHAPVAYQEIDGRRVSVDATYRVEGDAIGFAVGDYDRTRPLVIDPVVIVYATYLGGSSTEFYGAPNYFGGGIAVDAGGNAYVVGDTDSTDMPGFSGTVPSGRNVFVAKLNPTASALLFAAYVGGSGTDEGGAIALDASGNVWVAGQTLSANLPVPTTSGLVQSSNKGSDEGFVAHFTSTGTLNYVSYVGGSGSDTIEAIAATGNRVVLVGSTRSTETTFPITAATAAKKTLASGDLDAFVVVVDPSLSTSSGLVYGTYYGGTGTCSGGDLTGCDYGIGVAVDSGGRVVLSGQTFGTGFPTTAGALQKARSTAPDAFVVRFETTGAVNYATYFGGNGAETAKVAVGHDDAIYIAGFTSSTNLAAVTGSTPAQAANAGDFDGFVAKLADGATAGSLDLVYRTYVGGANRDVPLDIRVDSTGRALVAGHTLSANFPTAQALSGHAVNAGLSDGFATRLNPTGTAFEFSTYLGGTGNDYTLGAVVAPGLGTFVFGITESAPNTFFTPVSPGGTPIDSTLETTGTVKRDAYVMAFAEAGNQPFIQSVTPNAGPTTGGTAIALVGSNFVPGAGLTMGGNVATVTSISADGTSLTALTPAGTQGLKDIVVTNPDGQFFTKTSAYTYGAAPTVTSITPSSGPTTGGTSITIAGTNFVSGATVSIGGALATAVTVQNSTSMTATTPSGVAGARDVIVTNPGSNLSVTVTGGFTYTTSAPTLTGISPNYGSTSGLQSVTIWGANFAAPITVKIGGNAAGSVNLLNSTTITALTPTGTAGLGDVVVTTGGTTLTLPNAFLYYDPGSLPTPTLTSITPNTGSVIGGQNVTLTGTNFLSGATVAFGINPATDVTVVNTTTITAKTPSSSAGAFPVVVTNPGGQPSSDVVNYTFATDSDSDGMTDAWEAQYGTCGLSLSNASDAQLDPDTDRATNLQEFNDGTNPCLAEYKYFAEGSTTIFDVRLALLNHDTTRTAFVTLKFLAEAAGGNVTYEKTLTIAPKTRVTILPKTDVPGLASANFSTTVKSNIPLVADRTMTWDSTIYAAHAETGISSPANKWYLAEGSTVGVFNLFYLVQNPNPEKVVIRIRYLLPAPAAPIEKEYTLDEDSRTTIWVNNEEIPRDSKQHPLASTDVSAVLETLDPSKQIIVERAMYADTPTQQFAAGHEAAGVTAPTTSWYLAEGSTGFFDQFILVANPNDTDANVRLRYLLKGGEVVDHLPRPFEPNSRRTVWVNSEGPGMANKEFSTIVTSDIPIIVERAMWWPHGEPWYEAHDSPGTTTTATRWALAEGEVGMPGAPDTWILIANTSERPGTARVTLYFEDGTAPVTKDVALPASSRTNLLAGDPAYIGDASLIGKRFGAVIESVGANPIELVVERAMYWNSGGQFFAAGTNAVGTPIAAGR